MVHNLKLICIASSVPCLLMYPLMISSVTFPAVTTKYPRAQICCPQYLFRKSSNSNCNFLDVAPLISCTNFDTDNDAIIVTAASSVIPQALIDQLKIGGKLIMPVGVHSQRLFRITRAPNGTEQEELLAVRFVLMARE